MRHRVGRPVHRRLGILELHRHVGHVVFHRLEGADGLAELLALAGVLHRDIDHALGQSQGLGGAAKGTAIQGRGG